MAFKYTEEQLQKFDKGQLIKLLIELQEDVGKLTEKKRILDGMIWKMKKQIDFLRKRQFGSAERNIRLFRK